MERLVAGQVQGRATSVDSRDDAVFSPKYEPELALYASPVNFDPHSPLFPISDPPEYAAEIAERIGLYYTTGMVEDHAGLNNERISEQTYLDQCEIVWRKREAMMIDELKAFDKGFFYCLFDTPDRIQHLVLAIHRARSSRQSRRGPDAEFAQVVDDCYRRCDAIVGKALEFSDRRDPLHRALRSWIQQFSARRSPEYMALRQWLSGTARWGQARRSRRRLAAAGRLGAYQGLRRRARRDLLER